MDQANSDLIVTAASCIAVLSFGYFQRCEKHKERQKASPQKLSNCSFDSISPCYSTHTIRLSSIDNGRRALQIRQCAFLLFMWVYFALAAYPFYQRVCWRVKDAGKGKAIAYLSLIPYVNIFIFVYLCTVSSSDSE